MSRHGQKSIAAFVGALVVLVSLHGILATPGAPTAAAAATLAVLLPADIKSRGHLNVGVYCDYPPYGLTGADGNPQGVEVDLARHLAEYAFGNPSAVQFTCVKAASRIPYLQTQKVDLVIAALGVTQVRTKVIDFTKPYFASTSVFLALKGYEFSTFSQLRGKSLGIISGTPWITWLQRCEPGITISQYASTTTAIEALNAGRVSAYLDDSTLLYPIAAKNPGKLIVTGPDVKEQGYSWAFGVRKGNTELLNWANAATDRMQTEDFFYKNLTHWIDDAATLKGLAQVIRRPGQTPNYQKYEASYTDNPSCPKP